MTISYKLALVLKEAGFPHPQDPGEPYKTWTLKPPMRGMAYTGKGQEYMLDPGMTYDRDLVYAPTLEELIEACGEPFVLWGTEGKWTASQPTEGAIAESYVDTSRGYDPEGIGSTPSEAVAQLWLALNKKERG